MLKGRQHLSKRRAFQASCPLWAWASSKSMDISSTEGSVQIANFEDITSNPSPPGGSYFGAMKHGGMTTSATIRISATSNGLPCLRLSAVLVVCFIFSYLLIEECISTQRRIIMLIEHFWARVFRLLPTSSSVWTAACQVTRVLGWLPQKLSASFGRIGKYCQNKAL